MALKVLRRRLRQSSGLVGPLDKVRLRACTGLCDTGRPAIGICPSAAYHGADGVAISESIREAFDDKRSNALAPAIAVGPVIEGMRNTLWAQHVHG